MSLKKTWILKKLQLSDLQDDITGPNIIEEYKEQVTKNER